MLTQHKPIVLSKKDHGLITEYLRNGTWLKPSDQPTASQLEAELKRAEVVDNSELPSDVVSLNSSVTVKEMRSGSRMTLKIVIPELANVKEKRISILSPIGTALIGFRKADIVQWTVPSGEKTFLIEDVKHETARAMS